MRTVILLGAIGAAAVLTGCASDSYYASACEREYAQDRAAATAAGALLGGAAGAAIADDDAEGAAIGAAAGGLIGNQLARDRDRCRNYGYGYNDRRYRYDDYGRYGWYDSRGRWHPG